MVTIPWNTFRLLQRWSLRSEKMMKESTFECLCLQYILRSISVGLRKKYILSLVLHDFHSKGKIQSIRSYISSTWLVSEDHKPDWSTCFPVLYPGARRSGWTSPRFGTVLNFLSLAAFRTVLAQDWDHRMAPSTCWESDVTLSALVNCISRVSSKNCTGTPSVTSRRRKRKLRAESERFSYQ